MAVGKRTSTEGGSDVAEFYRPTQETLELQDEGIELSSAPVTGPPGAAHDARRGKGLVRRSDADEAGGGGGPGARALSLRACALHRCHGCGMHGAVGEAACTAKGQNLPVFTEDERVHVSGAQRRCVPRCAHRMLRRMLYHGITCKYLAQSTPPGVLAGQAEHVVDIHDEDYVPSAVPPAAVLAASAKAAARKPAKEGKLARAQKAAKSGSPAAAALAHAPDDPEAPEFVAPAAGSPPRMRPPQMIVPPPLLQVSHTVCLRCLHSAPVHAADGGM